MHAFFMQSWAWLLAHPLVALGIGLVLVVLLWKQPAQTFKLLLAILVLVALGYGLMGIVNLTMSGVTTKEHMVNVKP